MTRRIRTVAAALATLGFGLATALSLLSAAIIRSDNFGFDLLGVLRGLMCTAVLAGPFYLLFVIALPRPARTGWRLVLASVLATHAIVQVRFADEDAEFRAAVGDCAGVRAHRQRAAPFGGSGIGCHDGDFFAHD